jgi:membrane dipeptidase
MSTVSGSNNPPRVIVDSHEDIAFNSVVLGRDFLLSAHAKRMQETSTWPVWGIPTVGFPEVEKANVRVIFASIWAAACDNLMKITVEPCYHTPEEAYEQGQRQLSYYENLMTDPRISLVTTKRSLEKVAGAEYQLGLVISMEGADPILSPEHLHEWVERGLRVVGLAHGKTRYSAGTGQPGPLTKLGRELLSEMAKEPIILDTSHMAEESFFEALDLFQGPLIASHSNCRALIPTDRHLTDEMIRALVKREGVIGVVLFNRFLTADWEKAGQVKERVTLAHFVKQVEHIRDIAGGSDHIGIGSDLDGGFGSESIPAELDTVADIPKIGHALAEAGFAEKEVSCILGENWLRFLKSALPK